MLFLQVCDHVRIIETFEINTFLGPWVVVMGNDVTNFFDQLLLGSEWFGELDLANAREYGIFRDYITRLLKKSSRPWR